MQFMGPQNKKTVMKTKSAQTVHGFALAILTMHLVQDRAALAQPASATTISFQGALTGVGGQPLANGNYNLTFKFYDAPTGGTALATSNVPNVPVAGGLASTAIPVVPEWLRTDFGAYGPSRYLGVAISAAAEMAPRVMLTAVPYAISYSGHLLDLAGNNNLSLRFLEGADPSGFWTLQSEAFQNGSFGIVRRDPAPVAAKSFMITSAGDVGIGTASPGAKLDVNGTARMTVCQITSDRAAKNHFLPVNAREILTKLVSLPISTWAYTNAPNIRHVGPVAQDFQATFRVGEDDKHIATVDADGVALAAIQGLHQLMQEKDAKIHDLETRLEALEHKLESRVAARK